MDGGQESGKGAGLAVVAWLQAYRETLGITGVFLGIDPGGQVPYKRVRHPLFLLADKVIPQFK